MSFKHLAQAKAEKKTLPRIHSIVLSGNNALISAQIFPRAMKNRLRDPSKIFCLDFQREFRSSKAA